MRKKLLFLFFIISLIFNSNISADTVIDGGGHILALAVDSVLTVSAGSTLTLQNLILQNLSLSRLVMESSTSSLVLDNVKVCMDGDYSFTQGSITFKNDVTFTGTSTFKYLSNSASTIAAATTLMFDIGTTFSYAPSASASRDLIVMTNQTSRLFLNGCTLGSTTTGLRLRAGTLILDNKVVVTSAGTTLSSCIAFGDNQNNIDLVVNVLAGAQVDVTGLLDLK